MTKKKTEQCLALAKPAAQLQWPTHLPEKTTSSLVRYVEECVQMTAVRMQAVNNKPMEEALRKLIDIEDMGLYLFQGPTAFNPLGRVPRNGVLEIFDTLWKIWIKGLSENNGQAYYQLISNNPTDHRPSVIIEVRHDNELEQHALQWRDFVIGWYKHPLRCLHVSRVMELREMAQFFYEISAHFMPGLEIAPS